MIHKLPRAIAMIVLFFIYIPVWWYEWFNILMNILILLLLACGIYELIVAILEITGKNTTKKTDNALAGEPSQQPAQPLPQETVQTQPEQNAEVAQEKPQEEQPAEVKQEEVPVEAKDVEAQE